MVLSTSPICIFSLIWRGYGCLQKNKQTQVFLPFLFLLVQLNPTLKAVWLSWLSDTIFSDMKRLRFLAVAAVVEAGKEGRRLSELLKLIPNVSSKCQRSEARVVRFTWFKHSIYWATTWNATRRTVLYRTWQGLHGLYCTVLYCTVLYCTVLYCTKLY